MGQQSAKALDLAHTIPLSPVPGSTISEGLWACRGDGTIVAADGRAVCVLGYPDDDLEEQDVTNGAAILALPQLLRALRKLLEVRPANWNDGEDPELEAAVESAMDALAAAEGAPD